MDSAADSDFEEIVQETANALLTQADVDQMLREYGAQTGLAGLSLDDNGRCDLRDREGRAIVLVFKPPFPGIALFTDVIDDEVIPRRALMALLLSNASWDVTAGGTFSIADPGGPVLFSRRSVISDPSVEALSRAIDEFASLAERWETEIYFYLDVADPDEEAPASVTTVPPSFA